MMISITPNPLEADSSRPALDIGMYKSEDGQKLVHFLLELSQDLRFDPIHAF